MPGNRKRQSWLETLMQRVMIALVVFTILLSLTEVLVIQQPFIALAIAVLLLALPIALWYRGRTVGRRQARLHVQQAQQLGQLLTVSGEEFEDIAVDLVKTVGYRDVERVGGSGDMGVDLIGRHRDGHAATTASAVGQGDSEGHRRSWTAYRVVGTYLSCSLHSSAAEMSSSASGASPDARQAGWTSTTMVWFCPSGHVAGSGAPYRRCTALSPTQYASRSSSVIFITSIMTIWRAYCCDAACSRASRRLLIDAFMRPVPSCGRLSRPASLRVPSAWRRPDRLRRPRHGFR